MRLNIHRGHLQLNSFQFERKAFAGGFELEGAVRGGDQLSRVGDHLRDFGVVVIWVVVEEEKLFDFRLDGQSHHVIQAAVAPADVLFVFGGIVLGIHDQNVHAAEEINQLLVLVPCEYQSRAGRRAPLGREAALSLVQFVVGEKGEDRKSVV